MDLFGYGGAANDGIVLAEEMYLHEQQPSARWPTPSGALLPVTRSHHFADHHDLRAELSAGDCRGEPRGFSSSTRQPKQRHAAA